MLISFLYKYHKIFATELYEYSNGISIQFCRSYFIHCLIFELRLNNCYGFLVMVLDYQHCIVVNQVLITIELNHFA